MSDTSATLTRSHGDGVLNPRARKVNVGERERMASLLLGGALTIYSLFRRTPGSLPLLGVGAGLIYRATTGHCSVYNALNINTDDHKGVQHGVFVERAVTVNKSPEELYAYWRNFENLPRFTEHLDSVTVLDGNRSHWVAKAPAGMHVEWDAEIINEKPNELIAWRSLEDADIRNAGSVHFAAAPGGRGTEVRIVMQYGAPAGPIGIALAKIFGEEPSQQIADDLLRFKRLMETGEIPTTKGQPRGLKGAAK